MKKLLTLLTLFSTTALSQVKISQLPVGSASGIQSGDVFPYVEVSDFVTKQLTIDSLINVPAFVSTYAPLASPTFTGTVKLPLTIAGPVLTSASGVISSAATLGYAQGGTSAVSQSAAQINLSPMTTLGDITYENSTPAPTRLAGNTNSTKNFLCQTGTGSVSAAPLWCTIVGADLPNPSASTLGGVESLAAVSHNFLTSISTSGVPTQAQPSFTDISGTAAAAQIPNPTATTLGGVESLAAVTSKWINTISTSGVPSATQPAFTDISGSISTGQVPTLNQNTTGSAGSFTGSLSGDVTGAQGSTTVGKINGTSLAGLSTGILKNTTSTGVPSIAVSGTDYVVPSVATLSSLTSIGTIGTGTWQGTLVGMAYGGTNANLTAAAGAIPYSTGSAIALLAAGSVGNVLTSGGTGAPTWSTPLTNPMTTAGDLIVGGSSGAATRLAAGVAGQVLMTNGAAAPTYRSIMPLTAQTITSASVSPYNLSYQLVVTSANATASSATYTNNGVTFKVMQTISAGTLLWVTGSGPPTASGTLTKAGGTGDSTITFSSFVAPAWLEVAVYGAGGGGAGSATTGGTAGSAGSGATTFGSSLLSAGAGNGGGIGSAGGTGGACTITAPAITMATAQGTQGGTGGGSAVNYGFGGYGGSSPLGGGGASVQNATGLAPSANTGSGGGGAGADGASNSGGGGGSGCYLRAALQNPSATYAFVIATGGAGGTAGAGTNYPGAAGSNAVINVLEHYQ